MIILSLIFLIFIVMNIKLNLTILLNSHYNLVFGAQYFILESIVKWPRLQKELKNY